MVEEEFRPWATIWGDPRKTARQAIELQPMGLIMSIVLITSVIEVFVNSVEDGEPITWLTVIFGVPAGIIVGFIMWYLLSWLYAVVGRWLGGYGEMEEMRIGIGISYIPAIVMSGFNLIGFWIVYLPAPSNTAVLLALIFTVISFILVIWLLYVQSSVIGEVHGFSSLRGFGTLVLSAIVAILAILLVSFLIGLLFFFVG